MQTILRFLRQEDGATAVEYAVMLGAILAVIIGTVAILGIRTEGAFANSADTIGSIIR